MNPEIKVGQEWQKDEPNIQRKTRIRVLDVMCRGKHLRVGTVTPDGRVIRERDLLGSALSNTPRGYLLVKDVDATPEAKAQPVLEANMAKEMGRAIAQRITQSAKFHAALMTRDFEVNAAPTMPEALHISQCKKCEVAYPADVPRSCAPSPLEVVRDLLNQYVPAHSLEFGRSALSTLEESIRTDELARCIQLAEDETANPLIPVGLRLRKRLSDVRGKAVSLERWEESIRKDAAERELEACILAVRNCEGRSHPWVAAIDALVGRRKS